MDIMLMPVMGKPLWMWLVFIGVVLFFLILDLGVLHRKQREIGVKESLWMSLFYFSIALIFGGWIWHELGPQSGKEFITGFLVEKTLALDNVFIISLIFTFLAIPSLYQHRVLFWGILGVIILRGIMIALGATLVSEFSWVLYVFALFLVATGVKMLYIGDKVPDIANNPLLKLLNRAFRVTPELHQQRFFVRKPDPVTGKRVTWCTPPSYSTLI